MNTKAHHYFCGVAITENGNIAHNQLITLIMKLKLLFLAMALTLCGLPLLTSCQRDFNLEKSQKLVKLHTLPTDYTKSELKDMEEQVELYMSMIEQKAEDVVNAKNSLDKQRAEDEFRAAYIEDKDSHTAFLQMWIKLSANKLSDKKKVKDIGRRMSTIDSRMIRNI